MNKWIWVFLWFSLPASGANYYVSKTGNDNHSCDQAQDVNSPKLTLDNAIACMASGDTLYVRAGVYAAPTQMPPSGASWSSPTIIRRFSSDIVTVVGTGVVIQNRSYLVWDGINVDARTSTDQAMWLGGSHHLRITNSELYGTNGRTAFGILGGFGNAGFLEITRNKFHNFGQEYTHHGIYLGSANNLIEYNEFYAIAGACVHLYTGNGSTTDTSNTIIRYNWCHDTAGTNKGFTQNAGFIAWDGSNTQIYGNILSNLDGAGFSITGVGLKVYNNTLYRTRSFAIGLEGNSHSVKNNIFWETCFADPTCNGWPFKIYGPGDISSGSVKTNNLCDAPEAGCALTSNPLFVAPEANDLQLQSGSPAINAGENLSLSGVELDYLGVLRNDGAFDLGAFEFSDSTVDTTPPSVTITSPAEGSIVIRVQI